MPDLRRPSLRLSVGLAVVVVGLVEIQSLVQTLEGQARLREREARVQRESLALARPRITAALLPGGPEAWAAAVREGLRVPRVQEAEVFAPDARLLVREPAGGAPVAHWPNAAERRALRAGSIVSAGPFLGGASRLLLYAELPSGGETVVLRLAAAVPDLVEDLRGRRTLFYGHGLALLALLVAGALALFPSKDAEAAPGAGALGAYEAAIERFGERDRITLQRHAAERRRLEETVRDAEALARAGELTAAIVHEIRNGLGTILGYARMVEREAGSGPPAEAGRAIREECETLETVTRRFMDFLRQDALRLEPFDPGRALSRVVGRESRSRPGTEVSLRAVEVPPIEGDEELLERAFENLVRNALEAAGPEGHVVVSVEPDGEGARIVVADDGPGLLLDPGEAPRPFHTTKPGGLGLGLPMAYKIVRLHGGRVEFEPRAPRGLAVVVTLPPRPPSAEAVVTEGSNS
jgi:signal transduction histidine kinase